MTGVQTCALPIFNTDDRDVKRFLALFTFLEIDEVARLGAAEGAQINASKQVLAFEATKLCHGEAAAIEARAAAKAAFSGGNPGGSDLSAMPSTSVDAARLDAGIGVIELFAECGICASKGEARRLVQQGGAYVNDVVVADDKVRVTVADLRDGAILLRAGKKKYHRLVAA